MSISDTFDIDDGSPEIPPAIGDSIAMWRRTISKAAPGNERGILLNAAADLFRTRKVSRTVWPDSDGIVNQAIVDALYEMANTADIDDADAQHIFAQAQREDAESPKQNGSAAIDEPPPAQSPEEYGNAVPATIDYPEPTIIPAAFVTPADWPDEAPPPVDWLAATRIPRGDVTTLHGDGGAGKTDIAIRLAANVARGAQVWFAHEIAAGPVVFVSAEEPERELRRRAWLHAEHDGYRFEAITGLHLWFPDKSGDGVMAVPNYRTGIMQPTPLMCRIAVAIEQAAPVLVVVDNVAATFAGNQNDRVMVRSYVNLWRRIANGPSKPAVLLLDHPSLSGLTNNTGRGGNMDWRNAVRSALWLHPAEDKTEAERGIRILETAKSNYGPPGNPIRLQWADGGLQLEHAPTSLHRVAKDAECDETFLRLLDERAGQGLDVSANPSVLYAPKVFADMPNNGGFAKRAFTDAMQRLLQSGKIIQRTDGPHSRRRSRLMRKPAA
jgi:RecA-family ATPase